MAVSDPKYLAGRWSMGLGPLVQVLMGDRIVGHALYEPYLVISSGRLESVDGVDSLNIPIRYCRR